MFGIGLKKFLMKKLHQKNKKSSILTDIGYPERFFVESAEIGMFLAQKRKKLAFINHGYALKLIQGGDTKKIQLMESLVAVTAAA